MLNLLFSCVSILSNDSNVILYNELIFLKYCQIIVLKRVCLDLTFVILEMQLIVSTITAMHKSAIKFAIVTNL